MGVRRNTTITRSRRRACLGREKNGESPSREVHKTYGKGSDHRVDGWSRTQDALTFPEGESYHEEGTFYNKKPGSSAKQKTLARPQDDRYLPKRVKKGGGGRPSAEEALRSRALRLRPKGKILSLAARLIKGKKRLICQEREQKLGVTSIRECQDG